MACPFKMVFASSMHEHPAAQEFEPGASLHFAFDDPETVDLTLDLSIATGFGQRGAERVLVTAQARCERCQSTGFPCCSQQSRRLATCSFNIVAKRRIRSTAVAMVDERSSSAVTNRRSLSPSLSGSLTRWRTARCGVGGSEVLPDVGLRRAPFGSADGLTAAQALGKLFTSNYRGSP
jgi:hypothetical protein